MSFTTQCNQNCVQLCCEEGKINAMMLSSFRFQFSCTFCIDTVESQTNELAKQRSQLSLDMMGLSYKQTDFLSFIQQCFTLGLNVFKRMRYLINFLAFYQLFGQQYLSDITKRRQNLFYVPKVCQVSLNFIFKFLNQIKAQLQDFVNLFFIVF